MLFFFVPLCLCVRPILRYRNMLGYGRGSSAPQDQEAERAGDGNDRADGEERREARRLDERTAQHAARQLAGAACGIEDPAAAAAMLLSAELGGEGHG